VIRKVSKADFRKALCGRAMGGCEVLALPNGESWVRNGRILAVQITGILGSTYYLESQQ
jgi:hypothetical protein